MRNSTVIKLVENAGYPAQSRDIHSINQVLTTLGISLDDDFADLYRNYDVSLFTSSNTNERLQDALSVFEDNAPVEFDPWETPIGLSSKFAREVWEVPDSFVCFTSCEGEGGFFYDCESKSVFDFTLGNEQLLTVPRWKSLREFIEWFFSK